MCQMLQYQQHIDHVNYNQSNDNNSNNNNNDNNINNNNEDNNDNYDELSLSDKEIIESTKKDLKNIISHRTCSFIQYSVSLNENTEFDNNNDDNDDETDINDVYLPPFVRKPLEDIRLASNPSGYYYYYY